MTAARYPSLQENMTLSDHRQASVRWARRALRPDSAVIIGLGTTAPEGGALVEIAVIDTDRTIRLNTLINPRTPISPMMCREHHITDDMLAGAPTFGQILTELIRITDGHSIARISIRHGDRGVAPREPRPRIPGGSRCLAEYRAGAVELARPPRPLLPAAPVTARPGPVRRRLECPAGHRNELNGPRLSPSPGAANDP